MFLTYKWDIGPYLCTVKCVLDIQMCFGHTNEKMLLLALFTPHTVEPLRISSRTRETDAKKYYLSPGTEGGRNVSKTSTY